MVTASARMIPMHLFFGLAVRGLVRYLYMDDMNVQSIVIMKMIPDPTMMYPMICLMAITIAWIGVYWLSRLGLMDNEDLTKNLT